MGGKRKKYETVPLSFTGHTNDMRTATLKITICRNATVSEALISPLNLPQNHECGCLIASPAH